MSTLLGRKLLPLPGGRDKVLLHSCCAPCSGEVMEAMLASGTGAIKRMRGRWRSPSASPQNLGSCWFYGHQPKLPALVRTA